MANYFVRKADLAKLKLINNCCYCGSCDKLTIDHILPQAKGGNNELSNLTIACAKCNRLKWDFTIDVFKQRIESKRNTSFDKFFSFSGRYKRYKKRNPQHSELNMLLIKMLHFRKEHSYYSAIINSITTEKYKIYG